MCISCGRGFHDECEKKKGCKVCHPIPTSSEIKILQGRGRPLLDPEKITDKESTGRKRAAQLYPLYKDKYCEWRGLKNCGGGLKPIIGCISGLQQHRQHGPIKDVRENSPGNVHRICATCHVRWHTLNDPLYEETVYKNLPHSPESATVEELMSNDRWWKTKPKDRELLNG